MKSFFPLALLVILCLPTSVLLAQNYCGFDQFMQHHHADDASRQAEEDCNYRILNKMLELTPNMRASEYVVPVVVHVIHDNGAENIPDGQIETAIDQLNDAFANANLLFNPDGVNIPIRFCLAGTDPNGELTNGIVRVQNPLTNMIVPTQDLALKNVSRWDTELYLNIWLVRSIVRVPNNSNVIGYATFPSSHGSAIDGVVMEAEFFGITNGYSTVHIHEVGHYLGLYHTFHNGCPNDNCQTSGDWICDTPPDNHVFTLFCYDGTNSCTTDPDDLSENNPFRPIALGGLGDQVDEQDNYMDYSNLLCFNQFTPLQGDRMVAALLSERASLLEGDRCSTPCDFPFEVAFTAEELNVFVGNPYTFSAAGSGFTLVEWFVNGALTATGSTVQLSFAQEGQYEVKGIASNGVLGCEQEVKYQITAVCEAVASFATNGSQFPVGATLSYAYNGSAATSFQWRINGVVVSNATNLTYTFDVAGINTVQLTVSNGLCDDTFTHYLAIGNCATGREANVWYLFNTSGNFFGLDFNQTDDGFLITNQPSIPTPFGHNKSTFCDAAGNARYISKGTSVLNANAQTLQNGQDLQSHTSAHYGSLFVRRPESSNQVYLFTCGATEANFSHGLRYNLIDDDLNNGDGGVVANEKNIFIDALNMESAVAIRHCNLVDFWLVYYIQGSSTFKARLVTAEGISQTVVNSVMPTEYYTQFDIHFPFVVNGPGNRLTRLGHTFSFDPATGVVEHLHSVNMTYIFASAWSLGSRYIYFEQGDLSTSIYRIDTHLPVEEWNNNIELAHQSPSTFYSFTMGLAPNGKIYFENIFSGWIGVIEHPDAPLEDISVVQNAHFIAGFFNGLQNNFHGYIYGPSLFLEGEPVVCAEGTHSYNVFRSECITAPVTWTVNGPAELTEISNGEVELYFQGQGMVSLIAEAELSCGTIVDTLYIQVNPPLQLNLGPDQPLCAGDQITLDAGEGFETYSWQDGSTNSTLAVSTPGVYAVTVTNGVCNASDSFIVTGIVGGTINLGPDFEVCNEPVVLSVEPHFVNAVWQDGSIGQTYTVYEAGLYWVTANTPCFATDSVLVTDCGLTINSILEVEKASGLTVWPNPASTELNVSSKWPIVSVQLYDAAGRLVYTDEQVSTPNMLISVNEFESGHYMLSVKTTDGIERTRVQLIR